MRPPRCSASEFHECGNSFRRQVRGRLQRACLVWSSALIHSSRASHTKSKAIGLPLVDASFFLKKRRDLQMCAPRSLADFTSVKSSTLTHSISYSSSVDQCSEKTLILWSRCTPSVSPSLVTKLAVQHGHEKTFAPRLAEHSSCGLVCIGFWITSPFEQVFRSCFEPVFAFPLLCVVPCIEYMISPHGCSLCPSLQHPLHWHPNRGFFGLWPLSVFSNFCEQFALSFFAFDVLVGVAGAFLLVWFGLVVKPRWLDFISDTCMVSFSRNVSIVFVWLQSVVRSHGGSHHCCSKRVWCISKCSRHISVRISKFLYLAALVGHSK